MPSALTDFERWIKDQAYMKRLKNYCVVNPNQVMAKGSNKKQIKQFWKAGPVHMASAAYVKLAEGLLDSLESLTFVRPTTTPEDAEEHAAGPSAAQHSPAAAASTQQDRRKHWVKYDDALVHRYYNQDGLRGHSAPRGNPWQGRGGHSLNRGHRGQRGPRGHRGASRGHRGRGYRPY
jgi:hypothetical protein